MLRVILICVLYFSVVMCMTTTKAPHHHGTNHPHSPKPSQEPGEHESFKFVYEPHSQMMLVASAKSCYVFSLTDAERAAIHTDAGIRAVELKLLGNLSTASVTEVTKDQLDAKTAHLCGGHVQHYYKENGI